MDEMLMILPARCCFIWRAAYFVHRNAPVRLVAMTRCHAESSSSMTEARWPMPALLTRMSNLPNLSIVAVIARRTDSSSATSSSLAACSGPRSSSTLALRCARRPAITTRAPWSRIASAIARPRPLLPPVINATLPSSEKGRSTGSKERYGADFYTFPKWRIRRCGRILECTMTYEACPAVRLGIIGLQKDDLLGRHLREIPPFVTRRMTHHIDLAISLSIAQGHRHEVLGHRRFYVAHR